ncbi:monoamine oxidase [Pseudomassariella vexata]|uniref:Amine oxidase n=1 Tax=Pseudomassariella vexata TaxID=1141098 RepID=A0A1Y2D8U7_9PEZI|nr:monoamine oxidase [Pseudomassariella vexata]ORY55681.1 monoamine oxidase [Pseudomassariella vexata]
MDSIDVAIIGAGLSGLQAATDLQAAGFSFVVLEARDRVGGKTCSIQRADGKGVQELGAAWINDTNQERAWALAKKFGLTPITQNIKGEVGFQDVNGECHSFMYGEMPKFSKVEKQDAVRIRDLVEAATLDPANFIGARRAELDSISFEEFIRAEGASKRALQTACIWFHGMLGTEPSEVSALSYLEMCRGGLGIMNLRNDGKHGAQYLRLREGTQSLANGLARELPADRIKLSSPVTAITQLGKERYGVTLSSGEVVFSKKVIVSIPSTTYRNIKFSPPLPPQRQAYATAVRYGWYVKYLLLFKTPFWRNGSRCGLAQSLAGPVSIFRDTSDDGTENYALTCFIGSRPGRKWNALPEAERQRAVLEQISQIFGVDSKTLKDNFIEALTSPWMEDRWAGFGCPVPTTPPGVLGNLEGNFLFEPFNGVYFVGTELTDEWRGYMEGALRSGARGAKQILDAFSEGSKL